MLAGDAERDPVLRNSKPKLGRYLGSPFNGLPQEGAEIECTYTMYLYSTADLLFTEPSTSKR